MREEGRSEASLRAVRECGLRVCERGCRRVMQPSNRGKTLSALQVVTTAWKEEEWQWQMRRTTTVHRLCRMSVCEQVLYPRTWPLSPLSPPARCIQRGRRLHADSSKHPADLYIHSRLRTAIPSPYQANTRWLARLSHDSLPLSVTLSILVSASLFWAACSESPIHSNAPSRRNPRLLCYGNVPMTHVLEASLRMYLYVTSSQVHPRPHILQAHCKHAHIVSPIIRAPLHLCCIPFHHLSTFRHLVYHSSIGIHPSLRELRRARLLERPPHTSMYAVPNRWTHEVEQCSPTCCCDHRSVFCPTMPSSL